MANIDTLNSQLAAVGDAIRAKLETQDTYKISEMPDAIASITTGGTIESKTITANGTYNPPSGVDGFAPVVVNVANPPQKVQASIDIYDYPTGFSESNLVMGHSLISETFFKTITDIAPIEITIMSTHTPQEVKSKFGGSSYAFQLNMFKPSRAISIADKLKYIIDDTALEGYFDINELWCYYTSSSVPTIEVPQNKKLKVSPYGAKLFYYVSTNRLIREEDLPSWISQIELHVGKYNWDMNNSRSICSYNYYLREQPSFTKKYISDASGTYIFNANQTYNGAFMNNYSIDAIQIPCVSFEAGPYFNSTNMFNYAFSDLWHCGSIKFQTESNNTPVTWSNLKNNSISIDFSVNIGFGNLIGYSTAGFNANNRITDATSYEALKNDPDAWSSLLEYSRYNHDSAVETINSLPNLPNATGSNTVKFRGSSGSATDGGAINTLTNEEIAIATAKGWTVTLV